MQLTRYVSAFALLALLGACGGDNQKPETGMSQDATADNAPSTSETNAGRAPLPVGDTLDGAALYAGACASCHGETGEGVGDFPGLVSLSRTDVRARLQAYRSGDTVGPRSALMAPIASQLSDAQIEALAAYLGG